MQKKKTTLMYFVLAHMLCAWGLVASTEPDFSKQSDYFQCTQSLGTEKAFYKKWIPSVVENVDYSLPILMHRSTFFEDSFLRLKSQYEKGALGKKADFAWWNSAQACEVFLSGFKKRLFDLYFYLGSLLVLAVALLINAYASWLDPKPLEITIKAQDWLNRKMKQFFLILKKRLLSKREALSHPLSHTSRDRESKPEDKAHR